MKLVQVRDAVKRDMGGYALVKSTTEGNIMLMGLGNIVSLFGDLNDMSKGFRLLSLSRRSMLCNYRSKIQEWF